MTKETTNAPVAPEPTGTETGAPEAAMSVNDARAALDKFLADFPRLRTWHELRQFLLLRGIEFSERQIPSLGIMEIKTPFPSRTNREVSRFPGLSIRLEVHEKGVVHINFTMDERITSHKLYEPRTLFNIIEHWVRYEVGSSR